MTRPADHDKHSLHYTSLCYHWASGLQVQASPLLVLLFSYISSYLSTSPEDHKKYPAVLDTEFVHKISTAILL
jgi:hypothetical protein